jgi:hypothetical protein
MSYPKTYFMEGRTDGKKNFRKLFHAHSIQIQINDTNPKLFTGKHGFSFISNELTKRYISHQTEEQSGLLEGLPVRKKMIYSSDFNTTSKTGGWK